MPDRIHLSRRDGWRLPENAVAVDRSTPWGNPFITGTHGTRAECLDYYKAMLAGWFLASQGDEIWDACKAAHAHINANLESLRGKNLACWCPLPTPGQRDICHAAVLLKIANA